MNQQLLDGLNNYIESLVDGGIINLVSFIEDGGETVTEELLTYLWEGVKYLSVRTGKVINNIVMSIVVYAK